MKRFLIPVSLIISALYSDEFSALTEQAIARLARDANLDLKTANFAKDMVDKTLKDELQSNKSAGFFVGIEGSLSKTTLNYTFTAKNGDTKVVNDPNANVQLGITAGYDYMFNDDYGLSTSLYVGKASDLKSDVSTGYFGHIANARVQRTYSSWKSGFDTNFLYQLTDSIRLSAGFNYRYTKYNTIPTESHTGIRLDAFTRTQAIISGIADDIAKDFSYTAFCNRGNKDIKNLASTSCDTQSTQSQGSSPAPSDQISTFGMQQENRLANYIKNYIETNADRLQDPNFADQVYSAAKYYKELIETQWNLEQSIRADLQANPQEANGRSEGRMLSGAGSLGGEKKNLNEIYRKALTNSQQLYENTELYDTLAALDVYEKVNEFIRTRGFKLGGTAANYLPGNILRQACGNYNTSSSQKFLYDKNSDCYYIQDMENLRATARNMDNEIRESYAAKWIGLVAPRVRNLIREQISAHSRPLKIIAEKLRLLEEVSDAIDGPIITNARNNLLAEAKLAHNTPAYITPLKVLFDESNLNKTNPDSGTKRCYIRTNRDIARGQISESNDSDDDCNSHLILSYYLSEISNKTSQPSSRIRDYLLAYEQVLTLDYRSVPHEASMSTNLTTDDLKKALGVEIGKHTTDTRQPGALTETRSHQNTSSLQPQLGMELSTQSGELYILYRLGGLIAYSSHSRDTLHSSMLTGARAKFIQDDYLTLGYKYHF